MEENLDVEETESKEIFMDTFTAQVVKKLRQNHLLVHPNAKK